MIRVTIGAAALLLCATAYGWACPGTAKPSPTVVTVPDASTATDLSSAKKKRKPAARRAAKRPAAGGGGESSGGSPAGGKDKPSTY